VSTTRLSARKLCDSTLAPTAAETALYQSGEIVADVPMIGIVLPPFCCLSSDRNAASAGPRASVRITSGCAARIFAASVRNVVALRSRVSFATSDSWAFLMAATAGPTNVCDPMSFPNASATRL
jgi:hypothetical protein